MSTLYILAGIIIIVASAVAGYSLLDMGIKELRGACEPNMFFTDVLVACISIMAGAVMWFIYIVTFIYLISSV